MTTKKLPIEMEQFLGTLQEAARHGLALASDVVLNDFVKALEAAEYKIPVNLPTTAEALDIDDGIGINEPVALERIEEESLLILCDFHEDMEPHTVTDDCTEIRPSAPSDG